MSVDRNSVLDCIYELLLDLDTDSRVLLSRDTLHGVAINSMRVDSLELLMLALAIERKLGVRIDIQSFSPTKTFGQLAEAVLRAKKKLPQDSV